MSNTSLEVYVDSEKEISIEHKAVAEPEILMEKYLAKLDALAKDKGFSYSVLFKRANHERQSFSIGIEVSGPINISAVKMEIERFEANIS
jgi:hypothetical protein